jgi:hypothetical protein
MKLNIPWNLRGKSLKELRLAGQKGCDMFAFGHPKFTPLNLHSLTCDKFSYRL